jgi:hypothetical protein
MATHGHTVYKQKELEMADKKSALPANKLKTGNQLEPPSRDPQALQIDSVKGDTIEQSKAKVATKASLNAAMVINAYQGNIMGKDVDITELVKDTQGHFKQVNDGDLSNMENMLVGQALALQTIFTSLAQRAALNAGQYMDATDKYLRLALKAQSQCRATLETLAAIKNPPIVYAKQANFSSGHQQVNNGLSTQASTHQNPEFSAQYAPVHAQAGNSKSAPNKLLEGVNHERMDTRAQAAPIGANQVVEAMGTVHRAKDQ